MPLKLQPPRPGKTPNYYVRGSHRGVGIDRSARTGDRRKARQELERIQDEIERGILATKGALTFAKAATAYMHAGGEKTYLPPILQHFGMKLARDIDQAAVDETAALLYPDASPATRNRHVYTPVSAVLKHAKVEYALKRPKGAQGEVRTTWLWEEQAFRLLDAAEEVDPELRTFLAVLLYTGLRLSEALSLKVDLVRIAEGFAFVERTKNEEPRAVRLPPTLVAELANHPRGMERPGERVFKWRKNGYLYGKFKAAKKAAGVTAGFHTFRHTWATWMRRYAKLDTKGLMATGAWKDEKSAARYQHVVLSEEARRVDMLPSPPPRRNKS